MPSEIKNDLGTIAFYDAAIAMLAGLAVVECYGVVGMAATRATDGLSELLKRENISRGVKVTTQGDQVAIDLYVIVEYGTSITAVSSSVIDTVKYKVESLMGISVARVNVHVQGVRV
ncbi:MAG: Asp23/Gls24 family envelope stress response protein [Christensenellales bacterium]|jgi:uncharacterized alkaline shock family protein YloU